MSDVIRLEVPLPPSPNQRPFHSYEEVKAKNRYKRDVWAKVIGQELPKSRPPDPVFILFEFFLTSHEEREPDNAYASLKWLLDALRCPGKGETMTWRQGIAERKGYILDDKRANIGRPTIIQYTGQKKAKCIVTIRPRPPEEAE